MPLNRKRTASDFRNDFEPTWCKGCSDFGVLSSLTEVLASRNLDPAKINVISGIGCSSRIPLYLSTFGMHTLHGRALPVAIGSRLARPDIPVIVAAGDGDLFSIGIGHFVHAARKNFDITVICMDNRMYAMTKNQASPTSSIGYKGSLTPYGKLSVPLNVLEFAIACEASFVSRTFAGDTTHMKSILNAALDHKGFSFVEVIAPCRTFDRGTPLLHIRDRLVDINEALLHDPRDRRAAVTQASEALLFDEDADAKIPIGVFWLGSSPTFEDQVAALKGRSGKNPARALEKLLENKLL